MFFSLQVSSHTSPLKEFSSHLNYLLRSYQTFISFLGRLDKCQHLDCLWPTQDAILAGGPFSNIQSNQKTCNDERIWYGNDWLDINRQDYITMWHVLKTKITLINVTHASVVLQRKLQKYILPWAGMKVKEGGKADVKDERKVFSGDLCFTINLRGTFLKIVSFRYSRLKPLYRKMRFRE